jgi:hypothetical protein
MKKNLLITFLIWTLSLPVCVYAQNDAAVLSLDVKGGADISRNDTARAREVAIQDAIEKSILKATSRLMSMPVEDDRFQPVKSIIIDEPDRYINNYKILSEMKKPYSYEVNVHVVVNMVKLKNDLNKMGFMQVAETEKTSPKVLLNVKSLKKHSDFLHLKEFLQSRTKIVKNIYPCMFEWQQAHFEIEIIGDAQSLADEVIRTGRYTLDFGKNGKNQIEITCLHKKEGE